MSIGTIDQQLVPPPEFREAVNGSPASPEAHVSQGRHLRDVVIERCELKPTDTVLDLGCGCGRVASQFAKTFRGEYHGLDIVLPMVVWCRLNISARFPNFWFHHADLANTLYSGDAATYVFPFADLANTPYSGGKGDAATYMFPFPDASFDVVFAFSVFTHLMPPSAEQYAREVSRVLRQGGRALLTFYLINDERRSAANETVATSFAHEFAGYRLASLEIPESVIAYEQDDALRMFEVCGLRIEEVSLGTWAKNPGWTYQDAILATK